jgi:hypothetical protein
MHSNLMDHFRVARHGRGTVRGMESLTAVRKLRLHVCTPNSDADIMNAGTMLERYDACLDATAVRVVPNRAS